MAPAREGALEGPHAIEMLSGGRPLGSVPAPSATFQSSYRHVGHVPRTVGKLSAEAVVLSTGVSIRVGDADIDGAYETVGRPAWR